MDHDMRLCNETLHQLITDATGVKIIDLISESWSGQQVIRSNSDLH